MKYTIGSLYYLRKNLDENFKRGDRVEIIDRIKPRSDTFVRVKNINNEEFPRFISWNVLRKRPVK